MYLNYIFFDSRAPRRFWRLAAYFYILGILFFSLRPDLRPPGSGNVVIEQVKNWLHVPAYAGLTFLLLCGLGRVTWRTKAIAFVAAVAYGGLNEIFQSWTPGRTCSWDDFGRNAFGALVAVLAVRHNPILMSIGWFKRLTKSFNSFRPPLFGG